MNKQEVTQKIEASKSPFVPVTKVDKTFEQALDIALDFVKQLDEPEKTVLDKEEAYWLEELKKVGDKRPDWDSIDLLYYITRTHLGHPFYFYNEDTDNTFELESTGKLETFRNRKKRLVYALLFGYTIEKEKVYTAMLKSTNEYLNYDKNYKEIRHLKVPNDVANKVEGYHFTEDELDKYNAWKNEAYEVNEVKYE